MQGEWQIVAREYAWARGQPLPELPKLGGFRAERCRDGALIGVIGGVGPEEVERRLATGSQAYVAWVGETPAACGWAQGPQPVRRDGVVTYTMGANERWLWGFVTVAALRGQGVYPRLLQAVLGLEGEASRFRIAHAEGNHASRRGIVKAGFRHVGNIVVLGDGEVLVV